jgi:hypothetical protein
MRLREWLRLLQTGHGRQYYRFVWNWIIGPLILYQFTGTWSALLWGAYLRGRGFWFALLHLPPPLVTLLALLWLVVFIRLRPKTEHPETLVGLVRFWTEFRALGQTVNDILHDHYTWTISVPAETGGAPAGSYPGIRVASPPRCPKCNFPTTEAKFKGGWYRTCQRCNDRRISRRAFAQAVGDIEDLSLAAWKLSAERPASVGPLKGSDRAGLTSTGSR